MRRIATFPTVLHACIRVVQPFTFTARTLHAARKPTRGVMGLLASMMEHCCEPSARIDVAPEARGSALTLSTVRDVAPGESLSICYVGYHLPTAERRRLLRFQHGFVCECARCAAPRR